MSGVEAVAAVAAVASFSQLLTHLLRTAQALKQFHRDKEDAPVELKRVERNLTRLHGGLDFLKGSLQGLQDDAVLPAELQNLLQSVLIDVEDAMEKMREECSRNGAQGSGRRRKKIRFALLWGESIWVNCLASCEMQRAT
ncbi:hypothetical protein BDV95DRAFT_600027 [Massariosphaeria phaeospora]|uniref:Uncharacterized protein n=1 Tax=Massariosphaeria phaeospora TaxID=100035 RepID=A0A7C8HZZ8_9PLEO|nr:hypothetical protein BDV95DRAFT_600027 [Massariosphaeria phaeospora]